MVLEAQDYVGGRIRQDASFIPGVKIELGAEILHGTDTELTRFAKQNNVSIEPIYCWAHGDGGPMQETVGGGYGLYYIGKWDGTKGGRLLRYDDQDKEFVRLNEALWDLREEDEEAISVGESLEEYLLEEGCPREMRELANAGFSNTLCTTSEDLSVRQSVRWGKIWDTEGEEDGDFKFTDSYSCLIDHLKAGLNIKLSEPVARISQIPINTGDVEK